MAADNNMPKGGFLAVLEAKYAALGKAIESYRAYEALNALGQSGGDVDLSAFDLQAGNRTAGASFELPTGALLGKSIPAAAKLYLSAVKRKQTTREITNALREGGVESTAANFENTVMSALHRLKASGEVLQFKDGWALAEFYPENLRNRIAKEQDSKGAKHARGKKKKGAPAKAKAKISIPLARPSRVVSPQGPTIDQRIQAFLEANIGYTFTPQQVGEALHETDNKLVAMAFARLGRYAKVRRDDNGRYAAA